MASSKADYKLDEETNLLAKILATDTNQNWK